MTTEQLAAIEARLRAATPGALPFAKHMAAQITMMEHAADDIAALIAVYKDAARERDKVRMLFDSKDASLVAIARERDEARAQLEAVTTERDRYKAALERIAWHADNGLRDIAREALKGAG